MADPAAPAVRSSVQLPNFAERVTVANRTACAVDNQGSLYVVKLHDADAPRLSGSLLDGGSSANTAIAVSGSLALVGDGNTLSTLDVSETRARVRRGTLTLSNAVLDVAASGDLAYVALAEAGLGVVDTPRARPRLVTRLPLPGAANTVTLARNGIAPIAEDGQDIAVVDVRKPRQPQSLWTLQTTFEVAGMHLRAGPRWDRGVPVAVDGGAARI